jgi:N-acyl-D-aspartate/D-glutamate deacylase
VRHGTTTVVVGNCSLGTAFGAQRRNGEDPILDCFTRVENIPKPVLRRVVDRIDWTTTAGYLEHLAQLPLGPNIVPLIPHSMLRIEAMGTAAAVSRAPTAAELARMSALLEEAMRQGYAGFSTDAIPFHYLANEPHTDRRVPTQYASLGELRALLGVVRTHDRVWQCTPDASNRVATFLRFFLTSGRLFGRPLKTSALTAVDLTHERNTWKLFPLIAGLLNSRLVNGRFHFQVLATPFRMYAEGAICPIFEEFESTRQLMACDIEDAEARRAIMATDAFGATFVREWHDRGAVSTFNRDLDALKVERCPVAEWQGETFGAVYRRLLEFQSGRHDVARSRPRPRRSPRSRTRSGARVRSCCTSCAATIATCAGGSRSRTTDRRSSSSCCSIRTCCRASTTAALTSSTSPSSTATCSCCRSRSGARSSAWPRPCGASPASRPSSSAWMQAASSRARRPTSC